MVFVRSSLDIGQFDEPRHASIVQGEVHFATVTSQSFRHSWAAGYHRLVLFRLLDFMSGSDTFQTMWRSFDGRELLRLGRAHHVIIHGRDGC